MDELVNDAVCRLRCARARCVVLAVDYPLAPERRFPAAVERCTRCWPRSSPRPTGGGSILSAVSVGGVSAGGNLAAVLTFKCRQEGGPRLAFQLLEVPVLDLTRWLAERCRRPRSSHRGPPQLGAAVTGRYLPDEAAAAGSVRLAAPGADLSGLPPAYMMTAELDPLRRDGERYGRDSRPRGSRRRCRSSRRHPRGLVPHPGVAAGRGMAARPP